MHALYLLDVCSMFAQRLLDVCSMFARSCKRGIKHSLHETNIKQTSKKHRGDIEQTSSKHQAGYVSWTSQLRRVNGV